MRVRHVFFVWIGMLFGLCFTQGVSYGAPSVSKKNSFQLQIKDPTKENVIFGSNAIVNKGERFERVIVLWGKLDFAGVAKEMVVISGDVHLRSGAQIEKSLTVLGGAVTKEEGAVVAGDMVNFQVPEGFPKFFAMLAPLLTGLSLGVVWAISFFTWLMLSWLLGLMLHAFFPKFSKLVLEECSAHKGKSFFWALMLCLLFVPGLLFLIISLIGIPFIPFYFTVYGMTFTMSYILAASYVGQRLPPKMPERKYTPWRLLYGLAVFSLLSAIIPFLGKLLVFSMTLLVFGAFWMVVRQRFFGHH